MAKINIDKLNQGFDFLKKQNIPEAEKIFEEIIKDYPSEIDGYYSLAILKSQFKKDYHSAIFYLKKAINIAPFFEGYKLLAENHLLLADLRNALTYLKQALIYNSKSQECQLYLNRYFPKESNFLNNKLF